MYYNNEKFEIEYTQKDESYIEQVINTLNESIDEYLSFFGLKELNTKVRIKFYDSLNDFKIYYEKTRNHPYKKGRVGSALENEIHMLSFSERIKERPNDTFAYFLMGLKHELVHICHIAYRGNSKGNWFAEGLATCLGSPRYEETLEDCTLEDLIKRTKYKYCYTVTKYILEHYSHEQVLEYAKDDESLLRDTEKLFHEAQEYYRKISK